MAKILLVEDDNNLREIYEARLQAEGYDIVSARDGEEALTVAMKEKPDLIISDVMMPKISGFDMLDIIRSTPETKDSKVIMMTALSQAEDKDRATKLGADRYLVKSQVTLEDVAKVAREVLEGETSHSDSPLASNPVAQATDTSTESNDSTEDEGNNDEKKTEEPVTSAPVVAPEPTVTPTVDPAAAVITQAQTPAEPATTTPAPEPVAEEPVTPAPVVAPEPTVTPTVDPAAAVITQAQTPAEPATTTPAPEPVTEEPVTPAPVEPAEDYANNQETPPSPSGPAEPVIEPAEETPQPQTNNVIAPTPTQPQVSEEQEKAVEALGQSVKEEQNAIAEQIENFIDSKKTLNPEQKPDTETQSSPTPFNADTSNSNDGKTVKKKVIKPINDLTSGSGPNLDALLKKEEEKEQMAQIAREISSKQESAEVADELTAEAALRAAARNHVNEEKPTQTTVANDLKISEDGSLQNTAEVPVEPVNEPKPADTPAPAVAQATQEPDQTQQVTELTEPTNVNLPAEQSASTETNPQPVIPHTNGTSIDGITPQSTPTTPTNTQPDSADPQPTPQQKQGPDPNAIAL